ncbi:hypothetical protein ACQEUX_02905 [Micromonospora sp. CA-259024]|uniref:hypothetical protein n=1 Tax=Micromonospora sp. CA-259024 TaxID=3239965 RepID=UPI003D8BCEDC
MSRVDDALIGPGATVGDRFWCYGSATVGAALALTLAARQGWPWWTIATVTVVAFDLYGGAVVNATAAAKRRFHAPTRKSRHHLAFVAAHVQPFVMAWLVPGFTWVTAAAIYAVAVAGAALVLKAHRPAAFAVTVLGLTLAPTPDALFWFTPVLLIKLLLSYLDPT